MPSKGSNHGNMTGGLLLHTLCQHRAFAQVSSKGQTNGFPSEVSDGWVLCSRGTTPSPTSSSSRPGNEVHLQRLQKPHGRPSCLCSTSAFFKCVFDCASLEWLNLAATVD